MLNREHNIIDPINALKAHLDSNRSGYKALCRRAVIYLLNGKWTLRACTVEAIRMDAEAIENIPHQIYPKAVLYEDILSDNEFIEFVKQVGNGNFSLGEYSIEATHTHRQWTKERVPMSNNYMARSGYVWSVKFNDENSGDMYEPLLAPKQSYYPDLFEAVKHWLPFPVYHGSSDSRKGEVILLLPESRAYFVNAIANGAMLEVQVAGSVAANLPLEVKGAWWNEDGIHHIEEKVVNGLVQLEIPETATRLEYVLADSGGEVYDFQIENEYRHSGLGRKRLLQGNKNLVDLVHEARRDGEGLKVEFKPFIELDNDKLKEIYRTVAAFANTQGGRIFLGIKDDCELVGVDEQLRKWSKDEASDAVCDKYLVAIRGKIRVFVQGEPALQFMQAIVAGCRIVIIEVSAAKERPISIRQDTNLYMRRGASNSKVSPEEWKSIICTQNNFPASIFPG